MIGLDKYFCVPKDNKITNYFDVIANSRGNISIRFFDVDNDFVDVRELDPEDLDELIDELREVKETIEQLNK